jgi:ribonucleoside-diphosphate reductase beta chain
MDFVQESPRLHFSVDSSHYQELSLDEQHLISHILAFLATADDIVNENLLLNFAPAIHLPETRWFYGLHIAIEDIHAEPYSLRIVALNPDPVEQTRLFNAIETLPSVSRKALWALR